MSENVHPHCFVHTRISISIKNVLKNVPINTSRLDIDVPADAKPHAVRSNKAKKAHLLAIVLSWQPPISGQYLEVDGKLSACSCSSKSSYEDKGRQEAKDELQCCCQKKDWIVLCDPDGDNIDDLTDSITEHSPPQLKEKGLYIWGSGAVNEDLV